MTVLPTPSVLWSFALVAGLLTLTPGVDTALVLRSAAGQGRTRAWGVIAGIQTGIVVWGAAAAVGVSALLTASQLAYDVLRFAGAGYLVVLGARLLLAAVRGDVRDAPTGPARDTSFAGGWRQGATTNLLNPKVGAFYLALLPQFIPAGAPHLAWGLSLAGVHVVLGVVWLGLLTLLADRFGRWLRREGVQRWLDGVVGTVVAAFGIRLAFER